MLCWVKLPPGDVEYRDRIRQSIDVHGRFKPTAQNDPPNVLWYEVAQEDGDRWGEAVGKAASAYGLQLMWGPEPLPEVPFGGV